MKDVLDLDEVFFEANRLMEAGDNRRAFQLFLRAAKLGHAHAQHNVALMYELGSGTKKDMDAARDWYLRSWRRNPQRGTAENLASLYEELGNTRRAQFWLARAK